MSRYSAGDILLRRKGLVMHRGVALGDGRVLHNTPLRGEHIATEAEFSAGKRIYVERGEPGYRTRARTHADQAARPYNLFTNNCEHTVWRATTGRARSPQLRAALAGVAAGAIVLGLTRHPGAAAASFAAVSSWFARR